MTTKQIIISVAIIAVIYIVGMIWAVKSSDKDEK